MVSGLPFDDLRSLARQLPARDAAAARRAAEISEDYAKAAGSIGKLAGVAEWLAGTTGRPPRVLRPVVALFAGTHGLGGAGATAEVQAFVDRCAAGGSAVNQACIAGDLGLKIFDLALDVPTEDISVEPAFDEKGCAATVAFGMEAVAGGIDLLVLSGFGGEAGRISAEAVSAALRPELGRNVSLATASVLEVHRGHVSDPLEILRRLGGRETAALVGAIVAARMERVPVILDGAAALAAASVVQALAPDGLSHCMVGDAGADDGTDRAAEALGLAPLMHLGLSGSDGSGGAVAAGIVKAAALLHAGAAEFLKSRRQAV